MKATRKTTCHKIKWLQFANRNRAGLQSWHSSMHFQISITLAILTLQLTLRTNCNFGSASTPICERGFSKHNCVKHWMHWCECHYAIFWWKYGLGQKIWHLRTDPKLEGFAFKVGWKFKCIMNQRIWIILVHHFIACTPSIERDIILFSYSTQKGQ